MFQDHGITCLVGFAERKTEIAVGRLVDRLDAVELGVNGIRWRPEVSILCWETLLGDPMCYIKRSKEKFSYGQLFLTKLLITVFSLY